jgi:hypothetical protein
VKGSLIAFIGLSLASAAHAQAPVRSEIPIREVVLSDGARRYAVPIKVGGADIVAGLDSGSTGLRILPGVLKDGDAEATSHADSYSYGAGAKLDGVIGNAVLAFGEDRGSGPVQLVQKVGCNNQVPKCAAGSLPIAQYGIQGDGLPNEGFKAILGVNMADAPAANPFVSAGAKRWIIELPRPGEGKPGRIVLNPTADEVQAYVALPVLPKFANQRGGLHDAVPGCLINDTTAQNICGAVLLDTGAPGITVVSAAAFDQPWANNTPATLLFADRDGKTRLGERLVIGRRDHASALKFERQPNVQSTQIMSGLTAYFAYSVLYDPAKATVAFKARSPMPQGPTPVAAN